MIDLSLDNILLVLIGSNSVNTIRYLNAVQNNFHKIVFITNRVDQDFDYPSKIDIYFVNFSFKNILAKWQISKILQTYAHKNIIAHIHQANSYAFHTIKAIKYSNIKCKIILSTWGSDVLLLPQKNIILKKIIQYNLKNADIITSNSLYMSNRIKSLAPKIKKLYTIYFGVEDFPNELINVDTKQDIILSNRLHKKLYNIDKIIHGFANLINSFPQYSHFKLIIAGIGIETENLKNLVQELNISKSVNFVGMLTYSDLCHYLKIAKIFISIPVSDSTASSILEAMAYGCYPILSNLPANLEMVIDQINGSICQNNDLLELDIRDALVRIANKNSHDLITKFNYDMVKQKAIYANNIKKFINLYAKKDISHFADTSITCNN